MEEIMELPLTKGYFAVIDASDYEEVSKHRWYASITHIGRIYVKTNINGKTVPMHRLLMKPQDGLVVDHIDHNPLNNRRSNLRVCTHLENRRNSRGKNGKTKGVSKNQWGRWGVQLMINGKTTHLGYFATEKEAAAAYNERAKIEHGEYAFLNDLELIPEPPTQTNNLNER